MRLLAGVAGLTAEGHGTYLEWRRAGAVDYMLIVARRLNGPIRTFAL